MKNAMEEWTKRVRSLSALKGVHQLRTFFWPLRSIQDVQGETGEAAEKTNGSGSAIGCQSPIPTNVVLETIDGKKLNGL